MATDAAGRNPLKGSPLQRYDEEVQSLVSTFMPGRLVSVEWLGPSDIDFLADDGWSWSWNSGDLAQPEIAMVLEVRPEQAFLGGTEREHRRAVLPFLCLCRGAVRTSTTWLAHPLLEGVGVGVTTPP